MTDNIVTQTLIAELRRAHGRRDGAEKRLLFARSQADIELTLLRQYTQEITLLCESLQSEGVDPDKIDFS